MRDELGKRTSALVARGVVRGVAWDSQVSEKRDFYRAFNNRTLWIVCCRSSDTVIRT